MKKFLVAVVVLSTLGVIACKDAPPPLPMTAEGMEHTAQAPAASASSASPAAAPASASSAAPAAPASAPASTTPPAAK